MLITFKQNDSHQTLLSSLSANPTKWSNTLKQLAGFYRRIV